MTRTGVDCIGLILFCAKEAGLLRPEYSVESYGIHPKPAKLLIELQRIATRKVDKAPGGVVFFSEHNLVHLAIYSGPNKIIHADRGHGFVVEVPWTAPWNKYKSSYWEFN